MRVLNWIAYLSWVLAALYVFFAFQDKFTFDFFFFIALAVSLVISGVVFFAFSRVIFLLTDIRDALAPEKAQPSREPLPRHPPVFQPGTGYVPVTDEDEDATDEQEAASAEYFRLTGKN
ncbi:hypothetical protein [Rhodobacter maris]|uniref:Uncharacterized protein n=1 Tax=Rhodobacter maris TaxID=446682 RepID=A0A285TQ06_9RHOB|nr:hypothetical protein [Rhodobacter maris]SOC23160.1 hypothetical protein SAMN05877831_1383 [Rhodobacter maris]